MATQQQIENGIKSSADLITPLCRLFLRQEYAEIDPKVSFMQRKIVL
jgi:hypothetical protein